MDKQTYKEMLAQTMFEMDECEKEVTRLQLLVSKYLDKETKLKNLIYYHPNNMELGKVVREMYYETEKEKKDVKKDL